MYTLDANIFVRDANPHDRAYPDCHALVQRLYILRIAVLVPTLVLAEVAGPLSRAFRDPIRARVYVETLRALPNIQLVNIDDGLGQEAADLAGDAYLRGADAIYVAVARRYGTMLVSLDREQRERAAAIVPALTPAEALAGLPAPP